MAPFVHKIEFPKNLAEQFSRGNKKKYNEYCFSYLKGNYPDMLKVTRNGKPQDPYEQGYILAIYKPGFSPKEKAARRAEAQKASSKKGKK